MKRFLSMLLVLIMVFSMIPQAAFAAEKGTFAESSTMLQVGENVLAMDSSVEATCFAFEPDEPGTYKFTGPAGSIVGRSGYNSMWAECVPDSTTNTYEWSCTGKGQGVFVGVIASDESVVLTVEKTSDYQAPAEIEYIPYVNTHTPSIDNVWTGYCVEATEKNNAENPLTENMLYLGWDGTYVDNENFNPIYVDFVNSGVDIKGLSTSFGNVRYARKDDEGNVMYAYDYKKAIGEYTDVSDVYPLTEDLFLMLQDIDAQKLWSFSGSISSWLDVCFVVYDHDVDYKGKVEIDQETGEKMLNYYCNACNEVTFSELAPGFIDEDTPSYIMDQNEATPAVIDYNYPVFAGETTYFAASGLSGSTMQLTLVDADGNLLDATVVMDGQTLTPSANGVYTAVVPEAPDMGFSPVAITVTNNSDVDGNAIFNFLMPAGSWENPAALVMGENVADIKADSWGYYYNWTAEKDGTLTITMPEGNWFYQLDNLTSSVYGDEQRSDSDPVVNPAVVEVAAGDQIRLTVNTYDPANEWSAPAGQLVITASFDAPCTHGNLVHVEAVEPGCENLGNIEHWYCPDCEIWWQDEALTLITNAQSVKLPITHKVEHVEAVEPGCENEGNIEYWYCTECGAAWTDASQSVTSLTTLKSVKLPVKHDVEHVEAVEPGCENEGNIEYWFCTECGAAWSDEAQLKVTNLQSVKLGIAHEVEHVEAKEATCFEPGNIEYWYCTECGAAWTDELLREVTNLKNVVSPIVHDIEHIEAVEATCHDDGNIEYWYCQECGYAWSDENLRYNIALKSVIVPATGEGNVVHTEAVEPGCHYIGNIEYWTCYTCEKVWADEALTQLTNSKNVILPATGSDMVVHMDAVAPACHYNGNVEYWFCGECNQVWTDEALTQLTNSKNIIVPALGGEVEHVEAKAPTCDEFGNTEYWFCAECEQAWTNEALTQLTNLQSVKLGIAHEVEHVEAKEATGHENGNIEYWYCTECGAAWTDELLREVTNLKNVIIPAYGACLHDIVYVAAVEPGCHFIGNVEHWYCTICDAVWSNEERTEITNQKSVIVPAIGGEVEHVEAKDPTCEEFGNIEYWYCEECEQVWTNEALTYLSNQMSVKLAPTHAVEYVEAKDPTCEEFGNIEYWYCTECGQAWTDELQREVTNLQNVKLAPTHAVEYVEAKDPTCEEFGNIEYWYCTLCGGAWTDELLREVTNLKNVILPAWCAEVIHVEAVAPSCYETGNIEHWYCELCDQVWSDEARMQLTNHKNVILPAKCAEVIHVEAVAPSCFEEGNIEHWYCELCDQVWSDEARMQLTNHRNVILPAKCAEVIHVEAVAPSCYETGNIEYWYCELCDQVWSDENRMQLTNHKNVILPAKCAEVIHVEADAPSCYETGNIEYWYCELCDRVWSDEALMQLTNRKNVILPATHNAEHVAESCYNIEYWHCEDCQSYWADENLFIMTNSKNVIKAEETHALIHVEAVPATCYELGNIEYWYCEACENVWADEALTKVTNHQSVIVPVTHDLVYVEAVAPDCETMGNIEHWYCTLCGGAWTDELLREITNLKNVILPAECAEVIHVEAVAPSCFEEGNIEHWYCEKCDQVWSDEARMQLTNHKNVILPAQCAEVKHVEAVAPSCYVTGNIEYWYCELCDQVWSDEARMQLTNHKNVILPAQCAEVKHVEAVAPSCYETGNIEYWYCELCDQVWSDEALMQLTNRKNVILPATHNAEHVAESCYNTEYWYCEDCQSYWADENLFIMTNSKNVIKAVPTHNIEHVEESCYNTEYWYCAACDTYFADAEMAVITNRKNVIKGVPTHVAEYVEAVPSNCFEPGNTEYWYCAACDTYFADAELTKITNRLNVIVPIAHTVEHVEAVAPSCFEEGNIEYWYCTLCGAAWTDELQRELTNIKNVILPAKCAEVKHVEAVAATCFEPGNIEYWYCELCMQVWSDEALMQLTNIKNVVTPITHNVQHIEAVEATCHDDGNIEYWYCQDCGYAWTDELLREVTNVKSVIVPATGNGNVVYMEAVEPGCHYVGHVKHWACYDCGKVWLDEALTQLTNRKNVIVPAEGGDVKHFEAVAATCQKEGNVEYWFCAECEQVWVDSALTQLSNLKNIIIAIDENAHNWTVWQEVSKKCQEQRTCQNEGCKKSETRDVEHKDTKKDDVCDVCGAILSNAKTGDMIMIAVVVMVLAGAAIVVLLAKKRREN